MTGCTYGSRHPRGKETELRQILGEAKLGPALNQQDTGRTGLDLPHWGATVSNRPRQVSSKGRKIQRCHMLLEASSDRDDGARGCLSWVLEARQGLVTHGGVQGDRGTNEVCLSFKRTVSGRKQQQGKKRSRSTKNGGKRQMLRTA